MIARARWFGLVAAFASSGLAACGGTPAPHGSPVLLEVYWTSGSMTSLVWATDNTPGVASSAPPYVDEVDFVFDRRIDGSLVEDIYDDNGTTMTRPKSNPPVTVSWKERAADGPYPMTVQYNSVPSYGGNTSYVYGRFAPAGVRAGDVVTFTLDRAHLASVYGEAANAPPTIDVQTSAFAVTVTVPSTPVSGSFQVPLVFSNRLPPAPTTSPSVHVRDDAGVDVPYKIIGDASVVLRWFVVPADCLGAWPPGKKLTVTVDPGVADAFGAPLAAGASATFTTAANVGVAADCGAGGETGDAATDGADASSADAADGAASDDAADGGALDAAVDVTAAS
ncbi:MAG TPA: hypothetical protein VHJ20_16340 [Polyangia bacterium]|nr:hypothetical protein [Polyangia bacterium]